MSLTGEGLRIRATRAVDISNEGSTPGSWPRSFVDASQWVARTPHVAGSLANSFIRTTNPGIMEQEKEEEEQGCRPTQLRHTHSMDEEADLQESLLYEYEDAEEQQTPSSTGRSSFAGSATVNRLESVRRTEGYTMRVEEDIPSSSTWAAGFNATNILAGVGLLATPYAVSLSGVGSLVILVLVGAMACYTGYMLSRCMDTCKSIRSYPDIGERAFGRPGRLLVSVLLYLELFCCCVDFFILEGDNLAALFPHVQASFGSLHLTAQQTMVMLSTFIVLPTVWLRDLSLLSFLSVGGIFASGLLVVLVGWAGASVTGFPHTHPPFLVPRGVPVALGLYSFCFSGHAVFPSLYNTMRHKSQFGRLLLGSFSVVLLLYGVMAVLGMLMFGPTVSDNITLDLQKAAPTAAPTRLAMWLVIINPLTKLALTLTPVAMAVEELIHLPRSSWEFTAASVSIRTLLLLATAAVAIVIPFFAYVMAFIGAFMSMSISIILPCVFYCKLCSKDLVWWHKALAAVVALLGVTAGTTATVASVRSIVNKY